MYPTRTPAPFAVELKRTQVKNNRINIMADSSLTPMGRDLNSFNFNHDNLIDNFEGRKGIDGISAAWLPLHNRLGSSKGVL